MDKLTEIFSLAKSIRSIDDYYQYLLPKIEEEVIYSDDPVFIGNMISEIIYIFPHENINEDESSKIIKDLLIKYIHYIPHEDLTKLGFLLRYPMTEIIEIYLIYRPEIIINLLDQDPINIDSLIELNLQHHKEYQELMGIYLPMAILKTQKSLEYHLTYKQVSKIIEELIEELKDTSPDPLVNIGEIIQRERYAASIIDEKIEIIKKYYYILAQVLLNKPNKTDTDKELIIRYLLRADDYEDSRPLRSRLFQQYYLKESINVSPIDLNIDEETIIQLANYINKI